VKQIQVEYLGTIRPVEAFDVGVLVRLAWLDEAQLDVLFLAPVGERLAGPT